MENTQQALIDEDVRKQIGSSLNPSPSRSLSYDPTKNMKFMMNKGLRKPGRVSFEVLRRASYSVHVARICINVLKEKITKTQWVIKPIDPMAQIDEARKKRLEDFFKHPNKTNETFRTLLDKMLEDLLVLDAVSLEKTRFKDGSLAEMYYVDAATIRPVFDEYGRMDVVIPLPTEGGQSDLPTSYVQVMNNSQYGGPESGDIVAAWPKKDFMYFMMHPQGAMEKFGYGMSPLESVMSVVANLLNADNYNGTYFEEGSMPPVIIQMMANMNERDLQAMREYMYSELQGSWHRPAIVGGKGEMKLLNLKEFSNRDMEFMEYTKFMARLMAAAYGLSGQDIGLTEDVGSKNVSETMKDLSNQKGYGSVLHLIKEVFNQEIIWKDFGFTEFEFDWSQPDTTDAKEALDIYDKGLRAGAYTLNEVREKLGESPFGSWADKPMVLTGEGFTNIVKQAEPTPDPLANPFHKPVEDKIVGGEKPYDQQAKDKEEKKPGFIKRMLGVKKTGLTDTVVQSPRQSYEESPVMFGELIINNDIKESIKNLFSKQSAALLTELGFKEDSFMYDFNQASNRLEEFVNKNPKCYGGVLTLDDIMGKKYYVYVKESSI